MQAIDLEAYEDKKVIQIDAETSTHDLVLHDSKDGDGSDVEEETIEKAESGGRLATLH